MDRGRAWRLRIQVCFAANKIIITNKVLNKYSVNIVSVAVKDVFIVAAKRTPFGTYGGKLTNFTATDLQEIAARAALEAGKINPEIVTSIVVGNVFHVSNC